MTTSELDRVALKKILKLRKDGLGREAAFTYARLFFRLKQRLIQATLKRKDR